MRQATVPVFLVTKHQEQAQNYNMQTQFVLPPEIREQIQRFQETQRKIDARIAEDPQLAAALKFFGEQPKGGYPSNIRIP
jgi:hypothetical protein